MSGRIHFPADSTTPSLDVDTSSDKPTKWEPSVFVGDVRLSEFRRILQAEGISAEFKGEGVLVCNDSVAVRKVSELFKPTDKFTHSFFTRREPVSCL